MENNLDLSLEENIKEDEEILKLIEERDKLDNGCRYTIEEVIEMRKKLS